MGVKFGEIDASQILDNEFRIMVLERVVDRLLAANPAAVASLNMDAIRQDVVNELQKKIIHLRPGAFYSLAREQTDVGRSKLDQMETGEPRCQVATTVGDEIKPR